MPIVNAQQEHGYHCMSCGTELIIASDFDFINTPFRCGCERPCVTAFARTRFPCESAGLLPEASSSVYSEPARNGRGTYGIIEL